MKNNNKGFSLVELIVVIAIMAVLVGVLAPTLLRYVEKSRKQKDESAAEEYRNAVVLALSDETIYDTVKSGAKVVVGDDAALSYTAVSGESGNALLAEVTATCGPKVNFSSKAHNSKSYTIEITIDDKGNVTATGTWQS